MKLLIIILLSATLLNASLSRSTNYVYDSKNSMVWQDGTENITLRLSFDDAISYCKNGKFQGKTNWHLPSRDEYKYIIDKKVKDEHKINKAFKYSLAQDYWTSQSTWRNFGRYGYYVFFKSGTIYYDNKSYKKLVRCVR